VLLLLANQSTSVQAPGASPAPKQQEQLEERDRLVKQVEELRQAGTFDEAVAAAERVLELERRSGGEKTAGVADALSRVAELHELRGDWPGALARRREALVVRERVDGKDHWRTADARLAVAFTAKVGGLGPADRVKVQGALRKEQEALQHFGQGNYGEAERVTLEILETYRAVVGSETLEAARAWQLLGRTRLRRHDARGAKEPNAQALLIRRKLLPGGHPDIAWSLNSLGVEQQLLGDLAAARKTLEEALAIRRRALRRDDPDLAQSLNNLGLVQHALRDDAKADKTYQEALAIFRKALPPDHLQIAQSLNNLGEVQDAMQDFAAAKKSHEEALAIRRKALPRDHPDIARSLCNLGTVQHALREYAPARRRHEEALAIFRNALPPDHPDIAQSVFRLGVMQFDLQEYAAAKKNYEEALAISRKALPADHLDIAHILNNLGNVQDRLGEFAAAKASHQKALAIRRKGLPPDHLELAQSLSNLGNVQQSMRDHAAAKASHQEALAIFRKALPEGHPDIATGLNNLAIVQWDLRDYAAAQKSYEAALAISRKTLPKDHPGIARCLLGLASLILDSGVNVAEAIPQLAEAIDLFQSSQRRLAIAQAEDEQLESAGDARLALSFLIYATIKSKADLDVAYDRAVRVKGSVTSQQRWARQARDAADPETARLLDLLRQVTRQIVGLSVGARPSDPRSEGTSLQALSGERAQLEKQLTERSAVYRNTLARTRVSADDIRSALPRGTALIDLVEYWHLEDPATGQKEPAVERRLAVFVLRPDQDGVVVVPLGPSQPLAELIERWRASYGAGKAPQAGTAEPGAELRKMLWEPLAKHLKGVKVVLVSPDGSLNGLPWAALPGTEEGAFLIHEYAFAVVPVPQLLPEMLQAGTSRGADPASLVVGNIDFDARPGPAREAKRENHFQPLAGTLAEATAVHDLFRLAFAGRPAELLTGKEATEEAFVSRAPHCSHLLVATHGFFLAEPERRESPELGRVRSVEALLFRRDLVTANPALRSGLVFAGANYAALGQGNAFLTALGASELDLHRVDLAVLSACETGLGKVEGGEGVLGLQRAFQLAGARTAVTSLWKVPDAATQALMTRFHRNLWEKKMPKLEALREAQLWLIKEGRNHPELQLRGGLVRPELKRREGDAVSPFYWAAFVLSGDWR